MREKMPRSERAKQFAPFDALKGLSNALRLKEYEHDKIILGELTEEKASELSTMLLSIENGDNVSINYYKDEHILVISGKVKIDYNERLLLIDKTKIRFDDLISINRC